MSKFSTLLITASAVFVGYAIYFDYNRRNSPDFRKKLRKTKRQHEKLQDEVNKKQQLAKVDQVKKILVESLENDPLPTDPAANEQFFMSQVTLGEQLASIPGNEIKAALSFYRALSVYPSPTDILNIYQKSIPAEVYEYIIMMIAIQPPLSVATFLGGGATTAVNPGAGSAAPGEVSIQLEAEEQD